MARKSKNQHIRAHKAEQETTTTAPVVTEVKALEVAFEVPVQLIWPNPQQPRVDFDQAELAALAGSIKQHGVIQPLVVEKVDEHFVLEDGERRLRAAKLAGLSTVPVIVRNGADEQGRRVRALVANLQCADLNPMEEARAYQDLADLGYSNVDIALMLGISHARVAATRKLLHLDEPIQKLIAQKKLYKDGRLADALLDIDDKTARVKTAQRLAESSVTLKAAIEACHRVAGAIAAEKYSRNDTPAMRLSARKTGDVRRPLWDALAQVGKVPPWVLVEIAARDTCERCAMRGEASSTVCRGCALVEFLTEIVGKAQGGGK